jgi:hypothetical protein
MKILLFTLLTQLSLAQSFNGDLQFSENEKAQHLAGISNLIQVTTDSMKDFAERHFESIDRCGLGLLFGFKSQFASMNAAKRDQYIQQNSKCAQPPRRDEINITSCELHTNRHLEKGFEAIGQAQVFKKIDQFLANNGRTGIALAYALTKLGWKVAYWNPDVVTPHPTPTNRRQMGATPTDHTVSYRLVKNQGRYYGVPVTGWMINFDPKAPSPTIKQTAALEAFKKAPYFIGVAHGGFHVFPGYEGIVNESHSPYNPNNRKNIEIGKFDPLKESPQGLNITVGNTRKLYHYSSGIVVLPPGPWLWF